jgi:hypothetical protein
MTGKKSLVFRPPIRQWDWETLTGRKHVGSHEKACEKLEAYFKGNVVPVELSTHHHCNHNPLLKGGLIQQQDSF